MSLIGIPADGLVPFVMVWELNEAAALAGIDRLMGVLPSSGWFERFSYELWADISGLSLVDVSPHAVIFLPRKDTEVGESAGPAMTLPAHELGHTYGISIDPRLKENAFCGIEGDAARLIWGADGGLDEYTSGDPARAPGNPSSGYWVPQGGEDPAVVPLLGSEQCDSHCFMGTPRQNDHLNWGTRGRWIDRADYQHLIDKMRKHPDPEVIFGSAIIDLDDRIHVGPWYRLPAGIPDRVDVAGMENGSYRVKVVAADGVNTGESPSVGFEVGPPVGPSESIFSDDFESGGVENWSSWTP